MPMTGHAVLLAVAVEVAAAAVAGPALPPGPQRPPAPVPSLEIPTAVLSEATTPVPSPTPDPSPRPAEQEETRPVDVGPLRNLKFSGLMQVWFSGGDQAYVDTFRLRRMELYLTADVTPKARMQVMIDPSKALSMNYRYDVASGTPTVTEARVNQASRILQNAYMSLTYIPHVQLDMGQFKLPLSLEGLYSSWYLETVERALFLSDRSRGGAYGDVRELGVMAKGNVTSRVDYQIGMFNGLSQNQNDLDTNDRKAVVGRVVVRPTPSLGLQLGLSGAADADSTPTMERRRFGLELLWARGPVMLKSEYMQGRDGLPERQGYYVHAGYKVTPAIEAVFRYDTWDPDTRLDLDASNVREWDFIGGVNLLISGSHVKCQVNYVRKTYAHEIVPSRNLALVHMQLWW